MYYPAFRPCSVLQTVELWIRFRPASLQNISRKNLKSVLNDALLIMKYSEFVRFALIEVWLIALSCELNNKITQCAVERVKQCLKNGNYVDFASVTLSLMDSYCTKFMSKPQPRNKKTTRTRIAGAGYEGEVTATIGKVEGEGEGEGAGVVGGEGVVGVDESLISIRIQADLLARKSYFLLLYAFDECNFEVMKNVAEELNEYISTYID